MSKEIKECACEKCVSACHRVPGWFAPGEAEKAAEFLGVPFAEFRKNIIIDYWTDTDYDPLLYAPRKVGVDDGQRVATDEGTSTMATCIFLVNDRCQIHGAKPMECRDALLCDPEVVKNYSHDKVNNLWKKYWKENPGKELL